LIDLPVGSWWCWWVLDDAEGSAEFFGLALGVDPGHEDISERVGIERSTTGDHS